MNAASDIDQLPPLREIIAAHGLRARKSLGQNFLLDLNLTQKIARTAGDLSGKTVFEIGPGPGGLTRALLNTKAERIIAIEKDTRCIAALEDLVKISDGRLSVQEADALKTDLTSLAGAPRVVVANLPYNIATPLLIRWLENITAYETLVLMFQKEVAERIVAEPGNKTYGRLSVISQWCAQPEKCFDVPASAFTPPPKVTSSIVRLTPRIHEDDVTFQAMEKITAAAFGQRRKMLRQSLKTYMPALEKAGISPVLRAEELSVSDFVNIARFMT